MIAELGCLRCRDYPGLAWVCSISELPALKVCLLRCMSPLLAQSGHTELHCACLLSGGKADMAFCGANVCF
jgi:hypothetical protein